MVYVLYDNGLIIVLPPGYEDISPSNILTCARVYTLLLWIVAIMLRRSFCHLPHMPVTDRFNHHPDSNVH